MTVGLRKGLPLTRLAVMGRPWNVHSAPVAANCLGQPLRPSRDTAPLRVAPVDARRIKSSTGDSTAYSDRQRHHLQNNDKSR